MPSKLEPPEFFDDPAMYAKYRKQLLRWSGITKIPKNQQAENVLYRLAGHPSQIQEKIDASLGDDVKGDDGLNKVIAYLDTIYAEDEMAGAWTKYKQFTSLKLFCTILAIFQLVGCCPFNIILNQFSH